MYQEAYELVKSLYDSGDLSIDQASPILKVLERARNTESTLHDALRYLDGARFANYSGQIIEQDRFGKDQRILFDLGCTCGEIESKNACEYGEVLVALLNAAMTLA